MKNITIILAIFSYVQFTHAVGNPPPTVPSVNLNQYIGKWHELRRIPNDFQDNQPFKGYGICAHTTAEYSFGNGSEILVKNTCERLNDSGDVKREVAEAVARAVQNSGNSKLKVNFTGIAILRWLGIGDGDYWILALGPTTDDLYSWVLVGSPRRDYGWILARDKSTPEETVEHILGKAVELGYSKEQFIRAQ